MIFTSMSGRALRAPRRKPPMLATMLGRPSSPATAPTLLACEKAPPAPTVRARTATMRAMGNRRDMACSPLELGDPGAPMEQGIYHPERREINTIAVGNGAGAPGP